MFSCVLGCCWALHGLAKSGETVGRRRQRSCLRKEPRLCASLAVALTLSSPFGHQLSNAQSARGSTYLRMCMGFAITSFVPTSCCAGREGFDGARDGGIHLIDIARTHRHVIKDEANGGRDEHHEEGGGETYAKLDEAPQS